MMEKIPFSIILLLCTLEISGQSPCSQYFTYIKNPLINEVTGRIRISTPPKNVTLELRVEFGINVELPTEYVGRLELAQSKEESASLVQQGMSLYYTVHFPLQQPVPLLTNIWLNNQQYCTGPRVVGPNVTFFELKHVLYPLQIILSSQDSLSKVNRSTFSSSQFRLDEPNNLSNLREHVVERSIETTTVRYSLSKGDINIFLNPNRSNNNNCGRSNHTNNINLLISQGVKTSPGQWPWLAAIFIVKLEFELQCAGSVITNRHVITAAHCFKDSNLNVSIPSSAILVSLGRYRLRDWREEGSVNREVESYVIHPDYRHQYTADSDLAILVLRLPVEFSPTIKPICIWSSASGLHRIVNESGYVVGWGKDEYGNPYLAEPRMVKVPVVSQKDCFRSDQRLALFTSNRTFCAGLRDGSGPCNGDSGSGLMLYDSNSKRYKLRGIVSRSLYDENQFTCDLTQYVVFVDVAKYKTWIRQQIST